MFDKHKRESLLLRDLLKKLIIIVIGSIVAAYGITLDYFLSETSRIHTKN